MLWVHQNILLWAMDMSILLDDSPRCDVPDPEDICPICQQATMVYIIEGELRAAVCLICDRMVG